VDVLRRPTYLWRQRIEQTSITQQRADMKNLVDRIHMVDTIYDEVRAMRSPEALEVFLRQTLEGDLWLYIPHLRGDDPDFDRVLVRAVRRYWGKAPPKVRLALPQERRTLYQTLRKGHPELIQPIRRWYAENRDQLPVTFRRDVVLLDSRALPSTWPRL